MCEDRIAKQMKKKWIDGKMKTGKAMVERSWEREVKCLKEKKKDNLGNDIWICCDRKIWSESMNGVNILNAHLNILIGSSQQRHLPIKNILLIHICAVGQITFFILFIRVF